MKRQITSQVQVGKVCIGNNNPIVIQSMNNTDTRDIKSTLEQIYQLADKGCQITRVAIPDREAALALREICQKSPIPVVADIHFDYRLALLAIENNAAKIRINPGNLGDDRVIGKVALAAKERDIPIRVGVNAGSIKPSLLEKYEGDRVLAMMDSAKTSIAALEKHDFNNIVVSLKASDPYLTILAYRQLAREIAYPLHLGVTEAGTVKEGIIRSAVGIGCLLAEGIGDTIRVSLTADPVLEIEAAISILKSLGLRKQGITFISCPTCGRTEVALADLAVQIESAVADLPYSLTVAVMGCGVNGPGEAKDADIGIAGGKDEYLLFCKGKIIKKVKQTEIFEELLSQIKRLGEEQVL